MDFYLTANPDSIHALPIHVGTKPLVSQKILIQVNMVAFVLFIEEAIDLINTAEKYQILVNRILVGTERLVEF